MQHDTRIERHQAFGRSKQRIDVDFPNPALLHYELAESHQQPFERGQINCSAPAHPPESGKGLGLFHHPACQGRIERRQRQSPILEHLD